MGELGEPQLKVPVPNKDVGLVIGKGGATISAMQQRTGANIQVPSQADADDPNTRTIAVYGSANACQMAQQEILAVLQNAASSQQAGAGGSGGAAGAGGARVQITLTPDQCGLVIGRGGCVIQAMQQRTGARIQIPNDVVPGSVPPVRMVSISGPEDACARAKAEIDAMVGQQHQQQQQQQQQRQQQQQQQQQHAEWERYREQQWAAYYEKQRQQQQQQQQASDASGTGAAAGGASGNGNESGGATAQGAAQSSAQGHSDSQGQEKDRSSQMAEYVASWKQYAQAYGEAYATQAFGGWRPPPEELAVAAGAGDARRATNETEAQNKPVEN